MYSEKNNLYSQKKHKIKEWLFLGFQFLVYNRNFKKYYEKLLEYGRRLSTENATKYVLNLILEKFIKYYG